MGVSAKRCSTRENPMFLIMFKDTIFDDTQAIEQRHPFEYLHILLPLNTRTNITIMIWEKMAEMMNDDESSLRDIDME
jgi:hypothetical protein